MTKTRGTKKNKIISPVSNSLTDIAHYLLMNSDLTYQEISKITNFKMSWLLQFNNKYKKAKSKFYACDLEHLIVCLGGEIVVNIPIFRKELVK